MKITFIHNNRAFLPEIDAYRQFFSTFGVDTAVSSYDRLKQMPDVEWHFMGMHRQRHWSGNTVIHEYASASVPPYRQIKDQFKHWFSCRPDFRLFLNPWVQQAMGFKDKTPFGYRDMGLSAGAMAPVPQNANKIYDFIYTGSVAADMQMGKLLALFAHGALQHHTLLLLSRDYAALAEKYKAHPNISFKGPVPQHEVAGWLRQAHYCINYKPNIPPHNHQTSTKLLEYLAAGMPVISTRSPWVSHFQQQYGGQFFYLGEDLSNFTWDGISVFPYAAPDLSEWTWEKQIRGSGVLQLLQSRFPGISF